MAIQGSGQLHAGERDWAGLAWTAMHYNPMAILLGLYRAIFSYGQVEFPIVGLLKLALVALAVLWLGYAYFLRSKGRFADEV
jgi:ABC-type polysaccharide/polyol phosphate export permease